MGQTKTKARDSASFEVQTFFNKFDMLTETPNAISRIRRLILRLAVQGQLVAQLKNEGNADDVLQRVRELKSVLKQENKLRGDTNVQTLDANVVPSNIPSSWRWATLGDLMVNRDGERIPVSRDERVSKEKIYDYYGASGVIDKIDSYLFDKPLLLIGEDGANLINRSTPIAFIARGKYWVNNHAHVLDGISESFLQYIELYINSISLIPYITGSAQPKMNQAKMNTIPVAVPPLPEQKRIVTKVDQLMGLCDRLEAEQVERQARHAALSRAALVRFADLPTPTNLKFLFHKSYDVHPADLRKSIINLAVKGQLVPQNPNDELVVKLLDVPKNAKGKKPKWAKPIDGVEKPFQLPSSWRWFRLGDISSLKHGYAFSSKYFTNKPADFVLTTPGNFYEKGGFRDRESKRKYYSGPVDPEFIFKAGDLIIPMTEQAAGLLGSPAFIPDDGRVYVHNQRLGKFNFSESIAPEFAFWFFNCDFFRSELARTCTGMKVRHTSPDRILRVPFPVGPLAEQKRIVAKVEQLMAMVDKLEQQLADSRTSGEQLMKAVVAHLNSVSPNATSR